MENKWDKIFSEGVDFSELNEIFIDRILEKAEQYLGKKTEDIIDLGCGTGDAVVKFAKKGIRVTGIDFSRVALEKARVRIVENKIENVELRLLDLNEISALQIQADVIFCKLVYAFVDGKEKFLEEAKRLMKKKGVFILVTPVLYKNVSYTPKDKPGIAVDFEKTEKLLRKKFTRVEIVNHDYFGERGDSVTFIASI